MVYTPHSVSKSVVRLALEVSQAVRHRILEPSVGDGSFLEAITTEFCGIANVTAIDIDSKVIDEVIRQYRGKFSQDSKFLAGDFLEFAIANSHQKFDLIVGNPPFVRKHDFSPEFRVSVQKLSHATGYDLKHLKNAWAAFIVAAHSLLSMKGLLAFIVPYELVNVDYGLTLQKEIFSDFQRVDIYVPAERAFKTIEQDAVVFVAQKISSQPAGVYVHGTQALDTLSQRSTIVESKINTVNSDFASLDSKAHLLDQESLSLIKRLKCALPPLSEYCRTAPGIVTGANEFFILSEQEILKRDLQKWCMPILKKGSYLRHHPVLSAENLTDIQSRHPAHLLNLEGMNVQHLPDALAAYIETGEAAGYSQGYKCRNRKPWYAVPIVKAQPAFFFKRSFRYPRIVINTANVLTTDTAYGIAPLNGATARSICFSFYNTLTLLFSEIFGRFYGGGVLELTPKEFRSLPFCHHKPSETEFEAFLQVHESGGDLGLNSAIFGDSWLRNELAMEHAEIEKLRQAWLILRNHRLRHGR